MTAEKVKNNKTEFLAIAVTFVTFLLLVCSLLVGPQTFGREFLFLP